MGAQKAQCLSEPVAGVLDPDVLGHELDVELARSRRYEHPFALLRIEVADSAGRVISAGLSRRLSGAVRLVVRWSDSVALESVGRYLVLLRETDAAGARVAAQKLLPAIQAELGGDAAILSFQIHTAAWRKGDHRGVLLKRLGSS